MKKIYLIVVFLFSYIFSTFAQTEIKEFTGENFSKKDTVIESKGKDASQRINDAFVPIVDFMDKTLFWDPFRSLGIYDGTVHNEQGEVVLDENGDPKVNKIPFVVFWLVLGSIFFTIFFKFINFRAFGHSIALVCGKYDDPNDKGEVSHFQALTTALSATVGLGNIAGVAIAITIGGPGATFWMIVAGLIGMSAKFVECTLGVKYRKIDKDGSVSGGPMYYLSEGLKKRNMKVLGIVLSILFSILVIGASFGGGNMFQSNQAFIQVSNLFGIEKSNGIFFGIILAILVGAVIIGGIKSIANITSKIVPFMAILYVVSALIIIGINFRNTGEAFSLIFNGAFSPTALKGGIIGVLVVGFQRAAFSNEAGVGSAAIAHSCVKTKEPITEGIVSILEPFIDTVLICTMTALVIIFTGFHNNPTGLVGGVEITSAAFESVFSWFPYVLVIAIFLFAFSTMISWSYYGLKGWDFLFGKFFEKKFGNRKLSDNIYRVIFLCFIIVGASSTMSAVTDFSDMMVLCMAFPNILGLIIMAPEVKRDLNKYLLNIKQIKKERKLAK